jgi:hypothetical protein
MAYSSNPPTIDHIIGLMPEDDISSLNSLYEEMLKTKLSSINEAVRTEVVTQNRNFSGIAGPVYGAGSPETTVNTQTGEVGSAGSNNSPTPQPTAGTY